jgi:hypothetical protein
MNTVLVSSKPQTRRLAAQASPQTQQFLTLSYQRGWDFLVLGQAPYPTQPVRLGDWQIVPVHQDTSQIPARTLERVRAVYEAGLRPQGFVLAHEAPMLLAAPAQNQVGKKSFSMSPEWKPLLASLGVRGLAVSLAALAAAAFTTLLAVLVVGAAVVDPILVAVTEDDYWIEIDRWWV